MHPIKAEPLKVVYYEIEAGRYSITQEVDGTVTRKFLGPREKPKIRPEEVTD